MTKDEVLEKLEEERESAKSKILYGQARNLSVKRYRWHFNRVNYAIALVEKLDEPKKVVIPEFIANDIEHHKKHDFTLRCALRSAFDQYAPRNVYYWFLVDDGDENVKKYISAWDNGYEVEKEKKYRVKIKGICQGNQWLDYEVVEDKRYFEINSESEKYKTYFTKQWLKDNWPEYDAYNNAGLLEFEEVEDD